MKLIDVDLEKNFDYMMNLANKDIPLPQESRLVLNKEASAFYRSFVEKEKYGNRREYAVMLVHMYNGKLLMRCYALRMKYDARKKKNKYHLFIQEIFRALEGQYYGVSRNVYYKQMFYKEIAFFFPEDNLKLKKWTYLEPNKWEIRTFNFLDGYVNNLFSANDIINLVPDLKYSQMNDRNNPIYYINYYRKYQEIEMLRKCGFEFLLQSKNCLNRLKKGDKTFMKFLFQMYKLKLTNYTYNWYIGYYKLYGMDLNHINEYNFAFEKCEMAKNENIHKNCYGYNERAIYKVLKTREDYIRLYHYLNRHPIDYSRYCDYLDMAERVGHNLNEEYWLFPNDPNKAHDKVMEEVKNVREMNNQLKGDYLHEVVVDLMKFNAKVNGYDIFITDNLDIIQKQCDDLYQCLIRNNYVTKVLMQEEILVFIWKDGKPLATAEVFYNKQVGQFYGDERGHSNGGSCKPTKDVETAFYKWLETFKPVKRKAERQIKYYKGFYSKREDGTFVGYGDFEFKIGNVYQTRFTDDEIEKAGAKGCNASNKVFHFCDSIEEISKHYTPKYYCLVEPLGPVLNCNGALLTNKLKIVKEIQVI